MGRCTGHRDRTEIMLKTAFNTKQSIRKSKGKPFYQTTPRCNDSQEKDIRKYFIRKKISRSKHFLFILIRVFFFSPFQKCVNKPTSKCRLQKLAL